MTERNVLNCALLAEPIPAQIARFTGIESTDPRIQKFEVLEHDRCALARIFIRCFISESAYERALKKLRAKALWEFRQTFPELIVRG
jgi:hypothetical protein